VLRTCGAIAAAGALVAGCAAPPHTYVASADSTSFIRVPSNWTHFRESVFEEAVYPDDQNGKMLADSSWTVGFDGSSDPAVEHVTNIAASAPAVYYSVRELNGTAEVTDEMMRNLLLPVSEQARVMAAAQGTLLPGFELVSDRTLELGDGVHGVHSRFSYVVDSTVQTFEQKVLVNEDNTKLYALFAHCSAQCFATHADALNDLLGSFTVRS
jgi:hypothetical protein